MNENWKERKRPVRLERRFEFSNYDETRDFLDLTADLSEANDYFPDMSFGRTHVSMTLHLEEGEEQLSEKIISYADSVDAILSKLASTN